MCPLIMIKGKCPKCGSLDLKPKQHFRAQGIGKTRAKADLNLIICNKCGYSELYEMSEAESAPIKRNMAFFWTFFVILPSLIGIALPIWLIWF